MLAAANFHRSSRSFWENYFQLCHDYSCKCRNVRLTALSLTADDQEIAAGRAQDTQTGSCSVSVRGAPHFYNDNNGAVTARILTQLSYPSCRKTRALMDEEKINLPNFVLHFYILISVESHANNFKGICSHMFSLKVTLMPEVRAYFLFLSTGSVRLSRQQCSHKGLLHFWFSSF